MALEVQSFLSYAAGIVSSGSHWLKHPRFHNKNWGSKLAVDATWEKCKKGLFRPEEI